jgi:hypothetical protein
VLKSHIATVALAAIAVSGCGGGDTKSRPPSLSADGPEAAVQSFIDSVSKRDWAAACSRLGDAAEVELTQQLVLRTHHVIPPAEQDQFGLFKDCRATLARRVEPTQAIFKGAGPAGAVSEGKPGSATVATPQGRWSVRMGSRPPGWRIESYPQFNQP